MDPGNLSPFTLDRAFAYSMDGKAMVVVCVAGSFDIPKAGTQATTLRLADEQVAPAMADVHWGDPATTSLRYAGQGLAHRPATEVYLTGSAVAPRGQAVTEMVASLRVADRFSRILVSGNRYWTRGLLGLKASRAERFVEMPVDYEHAFGGTARDGERIVKQEARNPVGRGVYADTASAVDQALPNIEGLEDRVADWDDEGEVAGYGPLPAAWQPRLAHAGTYDQQWAEGRAPLWPVDIGQAFFCAAAPSLQSNTLLRGGETVVLEGFSADGIVAFVLPNYRLVAKAYCGNRVERASLRIGALLLEPGERRAMVFWRCVFPLGYGRSALLHTVVRLLESWEEAADA